MADFLSSDHVIYRSMGDGSALRTIRYDSKWIKGTWEEGCPGVPGESSPGTWTVCRTLVVSGSLAGERDEVRGTLRRVSSLGQLHAYVCIHTPVRTHSYKPRETSLSTNLSTLNANATTCLLPPVYLRELTLRTG